MDLRQLEYFVHVADAGSFSKAAQLLVVAQPALSRQIRSLEVELRQTLFLRNGRGVTLTPPGGRLLAHARGISSRCRAPGLTSTNRARRRSGVLRWGCRRRSDACFPVLSSPSSAAASRAPTSASSRGSPCTSWSGSRTGASTSASSITRRRPRTSSSCLSPSSRFALSDLRPPEEAPAAVSALR